MSPSTSVEGDIGVSGIAGSGCLRSAAEFLTRNCGVAPVEEHQRSALVNEQCHCRLVGAHYPGFIRSSSGAPFRHAGECCLRYLGRLQGEALSDFDCFAVDGYTWRVLFKLGTCIKYAHFRTAAWLN